jgi:hypothetical protein
MYSRFFVSQLGGDSVQEFLKIYFSAQRLKISDHVEDGRIFTLEAETLHSGLKFSRVDFSSGFSIEEVEGFSEFFDFVFGESRTLNFLFGRCFDSRLWSRGHDNKS